MKWVSGVALVEKQKPCTVEGPIFCPRVTSWSLFWFSIFCPTNEKFYDYRIEWFILRDLSREKLGLLSEELLTKQLEKRSLTKVSVSFFPSKQLISILNNFEEIDYCNHKMFATQTFLGHFYLKHHFFEWSLIFWVE